MTTLRDTRPDLVVSRMDVRKLLFWLSAISALILLLSQLPTFINAASGEVWQIRGGQIPMMRSPSMPERSAIFRRELITILKPGDRIVVLESPRLLPWKKVMVIDGTTSYTGWIRVTPALGAIRLE